MTPTAVAGNPADCASAGIAGATTLTDNSNQSGTVSANGVTVTVTTTDGTTFGFNATLPDGEMILGVLAKGGSEGGNLYDYRTLPAGGVLSDGNLHPPPTGNGGTFAGISHILFCYGTPVPHNPTSGPPANQPGTTPTTTPTTTTTTTTTKSTSAVKGASTTKHKKKHHKKRKHHVKPRTIRRLSPSFTG